MDGLANDLSNLESTKDPVARLSQVLRIWRDKLVSFDGRNKQLYYRKLKSGDVDFELWYKAMGFQRRTQNLVNRFNNYWLDLS